MNIVIDALGTDYGIKNVLDGVIEANNTIKNYNITLVGPVSEMKEYLDGKVDYSRINFIDANLEVDDQTNPMLVYRDLDDRALVKALKETAKDESIGLITASNTGCVLVGSILHIGLLDGLKSPALACLLPNIHNKSICLTDCGANINSTSENLLTYAKLSNSFVKSFYGIENPKIGLLSNGSSDKKGDNVIKGANKLLHESNLNFIGNVEGNDVFIKDIDVLVSDGMLGNVLLKNTEAVANIIMHLMDNENLSDVEKNVLDKQSEKIKNMYDYSNKAGSFLLGTKKVVIKAHGNVTKDTILSTINQMIRLYENKFIETITSDFNN